MIIKIKEPLYYMAERQGFLGRFNFPSQNLLFQQKWTKIGPQIEKFVLKPYSITCKHPLNNPCLIVAPTI